MLIVISLILGAVIMALMLSVSVRFEEPKLRMGIECAVATVISVLVYATASKVPIWLALIFLIIMLAMMGFMVWWWNENGSTIKEMIHFIVIDLLFMLIAKAVAVRLYDWPLPRWFVGIIAALPAVMFVMSIGYFIANRIWFKASLEEGGEINDDTDEFAEA